VSSSYHPDALPKAVNMRLCTALNIPDMKILKAQLEETMLAVRAVFEEQMKRST
jgi:hypothetical protein